MFEGLIEYGPHIRIHGTGALTYWDKHTSATVPAMTCLQDLVVLPDATAACLALESSPVQHKFILLEEGNILADQEMCNIQKFANFTGMENH